MFNSKHLTSVNCADFHRIALLELEDLSSEATGVYRLRIQFTVNETNSFVDLEEVKGRL